MNTKNSLPSALKLLPVLLALPLLAACDNSVQSETKQWMALAAKDMQGKVERVEEPRKFAPYRYEQSASTDPFSTDKIASLDKSTPGNPKPVEAHAREVLESFPLESLKMVGLLQQKGEQYALIKSDANLFRVRIGNYMGLNDGRIVAIGENTVTVSELVRDPGGDWVKRESTLVLQQPDRG